MWRDQSNAIREVNQKKLEEFIEEVAQMRLALVRLKDIEQIIKDQDVSTFRSQIKTELD